MSRCNGIAGLLSILALLLAAPSGQAELTYYTAVGSASPNPVGMAANVPYDPVNGQGLQFMQGAGTHNSSIPVATSASTNAIVFMFPLNHNPARSTITFHDVPFHLTMDLRQFNPFAEAMVTFHGLLRGMVDYSTQTSTLVANIVDAAPRNIYFGPIRYYFVPYYDNRFGWNPNAAIAGENTPGNFQGEIDVRFYLAPASRRPPAATPEPSALVLAGIGLACAVGTAVRRKSRVIPSA